MTHLSNLIGHERVDNLGRAAGDATASKSRQKHERSFKTNSTNSSHMNEMHSYAWIDRMWKFYLPERMAKRPNPTFEKLIKMIWAKVNERVRSFDAQFLLFWVVLVFYLGVKKRLFFKIGWLLFR